MNNLNLFLQRTAVTLNNCPDTDAANCDTNLPQIEATSSTLQIGLRIFFATLAVIAVIYIIIAGMAFVTSVGDPQKATKARQTIIFAVIGLIIAVSGEIIVTTVLNKL